MAQHDRRKTRDPQDINVSAARSRLSRIRLSGILRDMIDIRDRWDADNVIEAIYLSREKPVPDKPPAPPGRT